MSAHDGGVPRFSTPQRVNHWLYFIAFTVLAVTGFILFWPWTAFSAGEAGQTTRLLHRIFAVVLVVAPLIAMLGSWRSFLSDIRAGFTWRKIDLESFKVLIKRTYWNSDTTGLPPQPKFMPGQKLNIAAQVIFFFGLVATGLILWFGKGALPAGVMRFMALIHALSAIGATCIAVVHIYMVTTLPFTRGAIGTMFTGRMPEDFARTHHAAWKPGE